MAPHASEDNESNHLQTPLLTPKFILAKKSPTRLSTPLESIQNLSQLLARASTTAGGLTCYTPEKEGLEPSHISYSDLLEDAKQKARLLGCIDGLSPSSILLLHLNSQRETIQWFWAATLAGLLPAISTPFVNDVVQRKKHLHHLQTLLQQPVVLTTRQLVAEFLGVEELCLVEVESLSLTLRSDGSASAVPMTGREKKTEDPAVLMLTSGSTGNAKAVPLRHGQMLQAVQGKRAHHGTEPGDVFLNWVGLDHVASLTEIHLHASMLTPPPLL